MSKKGSDHTAVGAVTAPSTPSKDDDPSGPCGRRLREFIEMCGRHPFATGLFALLSVFGLVFSLIAFGIDQDQSQRDAEETAAIKKTLARVESTVGVIATPKQEPENFDPVESTPLEVSTVTDNAVFPRQYMGQSRAWIQENIGESFSYIPFLSFSLKSAAAEEFIQIAPYLLIDVIAVEPVESDLAAIYEGGRGGAAVIREFSADITPDVGLQFAPLIDGENGTFRTDVDYFSLMPKEPEEFFLGMDYVLGYVYTFRIGVQYKYKGRHRVHWLNQPLRAGVPTYELPVAEFDGKDFEVRYHPDFHDTDLPYQPDHSKNAELVMSASRANIQAVNANRLFTPSQISAR